MQEVRVVFLKSQDEVRLVRKGNVWVVYGVRDRPFETTHEIAQALLRVLGIPPEALEWPQGVTYLLQ